MDWLAGAVQIVLLALLIICIATGYLWTIVLFVLGSREIRRPSVEAHGDPSTYFWVFIVPALNEERTIADSVSRLRGVDVPFRAIVVIDDGSDDSTGAILGDLAGPDLHVITRVPPDAQRGKGRALDAAYRYVGESLLAPCSPSGAWSRDRVIVAIVDADGRLESDAATHVSAHFADAEVGGVQVNVNIYNTDHWLARLQRREFRIFGNLFQVGRSRFGTAFMGGNGQFNRLTALDSVTDESGPWHDVMTEDQELGLRLLEAGWVSRHEFRTQVSQQGLASVRRLYRQRARWFQGNLQVAAQASRVFGPNLKGLRRLDVMVSIALPILQLVVTIGLIVAIVQAFVFGNEPLPFASVALLAFIVQLALTPMLIGVVSEGRGLGWRSVGHVAKGFIPYVIYTWVMFPVVLLGTWRFLRREGGWAKTEREEVGSVADSD